VLSKPFHLRDLVNEVEQDAGGLTNCGQGRAKKTLDPASGFMVYPRATDGAMVAAPA
jgi:hypothetical protein